MSSEDGQQQQQQVSFLEKLVARSNAVESLLCVGLDPYESELFPASTEQQQYQPTDEEKCDAAYTYCKTIIDQTHAVTVLYKPNIAFFEALGHGGCEILKRVVDECIIPKGIPILLDVKRGDIGTTAIAYANACYDYYHADAVTLSPLMGWDSCEPFLTGKYDGRGAFFLCKTSNPGSNDLLTLKLQQSDCTLYEHIASLVGNEWKKKAGDQSFLGLVVGATDTDAIRNVRSHIQKTLVGDDDDNVWILAPGVGPQGGDLKEALAAGLNQRTGMGMLIPVSRAVSKAADPAAAAEELRQQIEAARKEVMNDLRNDTNTVTESSKELSVATETTTTTLQRHQKDFLEFSIEQGVLKFGSFVLKSGRTSPYFFNAGLFASGSALHKLGKAYASTIVSSSAFVEGIGKDMKPKFDVIFGPAYKGISLGAVVSSALYSEFGIDVGFGYNRKEAKDHGEGGTLVGAPLKGKRVLIIDDVITAGTAIREVYTLLEQSESAPIGVVIALDRAEKRSIDDPISAVQAVIRDMSISVIAIVNLKELQEYIQQNSELYDDSMLKSITLYRNEYGA